MILEEKQET